MKARVIHTKFWTDNYILRLSPLEKLFFNFLITNEKIGISGVYEMPTPLIKLSTGLSSAEINKFKKRFMKDGKILFYKEWVYLVNANKYQNYTGEKNEIACQKEINCISNKIHLFFGTYCMDTLSIPYAYPLHSLRNKKSEIRNKKSYKRNKKKEEILSNKELDEIAKRIGGGRT